MEITQQQVEKARAVNLVEFLGLRGRRAQIKCPFDGHRDSTPSCMVYPYSGYYCFGCGKHGHNAIDFLIELGDTFPEAVIRLTE